MNAVLEEIIRAGTVQMPDGRQISAHSGIGPGSGRVISNAVETVKPTLGCEIGLAFGLSTLYILDAMQQHGGGHLIGMDPSQHDGTWQGGGLHNIRRAGFEDRYKFIEATSQQALPKLADQGTRIQFAFLDGWHTFDHTLVDFFYVDMMLDVGGVIILDDVGYPGLQRLAHFILCNRNYSLFDFEPRAVSSGWKTQAKALAKKVFGPLVRDNQTPTQVNLTIEESVNRVGLIALRKTANDQRQFDHFVPF